MIEVISCELQHTLDLGQRLGKLARRGDVIALDGELGAGKTQLVRGLAIGMNLDPNQVSSPTFVLMHEYLPPPPEDEDGITMDVSRAGNSLIHIDAYRITGPEDLATLGFDDELRENAVVAVEWASRIRSALGVDVLHITIEHLGQADGRGTVRRLNFTPHGSWTQRLPQLQALQNLTP